MKVNVTSPQPVKARVSSDDDRVVINAGGVADVYRIIRDTMNHADFNIVPAQTGTIALGSETSAFSELYLSGNSIYLGNGSISLTDDNKFDFSLDLNVKLTDLVDVDDVGLANNTVLYYNNATQRFDFNDVNNLTANLTILADLLEVDGSGSQLDADKLDGLDSVYFLDADNLEFSNTVILQGAELTINSAMTIYSSTVDINTTNPIVIDQFLKTSLRSAKYQITINDSNDTTFFITEVLLVHNNAEANITVYGEVSAGMANIAPTIWADINGSYVRLLLTATDTDQQASIVRLATTIS